MHDTHKYHPNTQNTQAHTHAHSHKPTERNLQKSAWNQCLLCGPESTDRTMDTPTRVLEKSHWLFSLTIATRKGIQS